MVDLELYRIFKIVAEEENITYASEKLNISQPAVTKHIQNLEKLLNVKLFERTNKGPSLTEDGRNIFNNNKEPIETLESISKKYNSVRVINLGVHATLLNKLLSKKISEYYNINSNVKINIVNKETRKITNAENRKIYLQNYFKTYDRPKKDDNSYEQMLAQQKQDSMELSYSHNTLSDYALAKWYSIYHTNSKGNLVLDRNLKVGSDIPKSINMNIKVPTQKYKNRYVYSY